MADKEYRVKHEDMENIADAIREKTETSVELDVHDMPRYIRSIAGSGSNIGLDGRGILEIIKTDTQGLVDTYTIYYTDETTSTFTVTNGKDGVDGADGSNASGGTGLTLAQINALDAMFSKCVFTEEVTEAYNNFKLVFGIQRDDEYEPEDPQPTVYTITRNLSNCTSNKSTNYVNENVTHNENIIAADGYTLEGATVVITMGGNNINNSYNNGVINIAKATGNIIITISAVKIEEPVDPEPEEPDVPVDPEPDTPVDPEPEEPSDPTAAVYSLANETTFTGSNNVDTGYIINDVDKDFSIIVDYTPATISGYLFDNSKNGNLLGPGFNLSNQRFMANNYTQLPFSNATIRQKMVITHAKDTETFNVSLINDSTNFKSEVVHVSTKYASNTNITGNKNTLKLGSTYAGANYFKGTIHQFEVYERMLTEEEINSFIQESWVNTEEIVNLINKETLTTGGATPNGAALTDGYYLTDFIEINSKNPHICNVTGCTGSSLLKLHLFDENKTRLSTKTYVSDEEQITYDITSTLFNTNAKYVRLVIHESQIENALLAEGRL